MQNTLENTQPAEHDVLGPFTSRDLPLYLLSDLEGSDVEKLYAYAYNLFEVSEFHSAKQLFLLLIRLDKWNFDYWLMLGLCCQRLAEHEEAIACFAQSGRITIPDPRSSFFAGISYQALGNHSYADKAFNASLKWCSSHPEHQELRTWVLNALGNSQAKE